MATSSSSVFKQRQAAKAKADHTSGRHACIDRRRTPISAPRICLAVAETYGGPPRWAEPVAPRRQSAQLSTTTHRRRRSPDPGRGVQHGQHRHHVRNVRHHACRAHQAIVAHHAIVQPFAGSADQRTSRRRRPPRTEERFTGPRGTPTVRVCTLSPARWDRRGLSQHSAHGSGMIADPAV